MHYQENTVKSDNKVRIISLLLLLPMYAGVAEAWSVFNKIIYPIFLAVVILAILYKGKIPSLSGRNNIFALLLLYAMLVVIFDFKHGTFTTFEGFNRSKSWEALTTVLISFLVIALRVSRREFLFSIIIGLAIFYLYRAMGLFGIVDIGMEEIRIFSKTAYAFVAFSASLLLYINGKKVLALAFIMLVAFQSLRANILAFGITIALYHFNVYMQLKKVRAGKIIDYKLVKVLVVIILTGILLSEIVAAFSIVGDIDFWENISTGRSFFYYSILSQWLPNGVDVFCPSYPGYAADLASVYTSFYGRFNPSQCPHSIIIEMMVDYGIIIGLSFILLMVLMSNRKGIFATCLFLITMSSQCEVFSAINFVTYLLIYRHLSMDS